MASEELVPLTEKEIRSLIDKSKEAKEYAHAPYSRFPVGAALLAKDGRTFTGKLDIAMVYTVLAALWKAHRRGRPAIHSNRSGLINNQQPRPQSYYLLGFCTLPPSQF